MIPGGKPADKRGQDEKAAPDGRPDEDQPRWRKDFPIGWTRDEYVSRRELVKFMALTSGAFVAGQGWVACQSLVRENRAQGEIPEQAIAAIDELAIGEGKTFHYPENSTPRLLVRTGEATFVAYDQQCTHLLCPVVPAFDEGRLHCPCHNGWFDLATGRPVAGPPKRPLPRILLDVREGTVYATGVEDTPA